MQQKEKTFKETFDSIFNKIKKEVITGFNWFKNVFKSYSDTITLLLGIFILFTLIVFFICYNRGGFFTINTDDIQQYYPIMAGFIKDLKNGTLSLYNNSFFAGTSYFANSYYIPLDIFTLLTYLFSFIMKTETAYGLVNLLKIGVGGMMMCYYMHNHGFKNKTSFLFSLIFAFGGLLTAECVFPVYWSLLFYIPLGLFAVDKFLESKYNFFYIPLYTFIIVLYDFYIAYMLLAFIMIYLVMMKVYKGEGTFFGKNTIFKDKYLYIDIFSSIGLVLVGLMMSMFIFLPSYKYITGKTLRVSTVEVIFKYTLNGDILSTYFTPGNPLSVLHPATGYITNHASMYMTLFGLMCLVTLFTMKGYKNRYLKIIIVLANFLLGIPAVAMLMTGTNQAYIRWFFIVYVINLYGAAVAFDYQEDEKMSVSSKIALGYFLFFAFTLIFFMFFRTGTFDTDSKKTIFKTILIFDYIFAISSIILYGLAKKKLFSFIYYSAFVCLTIYLVSYVLFKDTKTVFNGNDMMYKNSDFFWPILIIFFSFVALYFIALFIPKRKAIMFGIACLEVCASMVIVFVNCGNTGPFYYQCTDQFDAHETNLKAVTSYSSTNAYRAALYSYEAVWFKNLSFMYDKINTTQFFHSFYDSTINDIYGNLYGDDITSWHRREIMTYAGPFSIIDGVKYVVTPNWRYTTKGWEYLPISMPSFYEWKAEDASKNFRYYEMKDLKPFIVYDKIGCKTGLNSINMANALTQIGYFDKAYNLNYEDDAKLFNDMIEKNNLVAATSDDYDNLSKIYNVSLSSPTIDGGYEVYNINRFNTISSNNIDSFMITLRNQGDRLDALNDAFIVDENNERHYLFAGYTAYDKSYTPKQLYVSSFNRQWSISAYAFSFEDIYNKYLEAQSEYKNEFFELDGSNMKISLDYENKEYNRVLKTNFSYSSEWKVSDPSFKTINIDGGYLGIILPSGTTSCNIELNFEPEGFNLGLTISSFFIGSFSTACVLVFLQRRHKKDLSPLF